MNSIVDRTDPLEFNLQPNDSTGAFYYAPVLSHLDVVANLVFASVTPCTVLSGIHVGRTSHLPPPPVAAVVDSTPTSGEGPILRAVDDLKAWLNVSYDELAKILGWQSASNIYHWRRCVRAGASIHPRAATVEPILRLHALFRAVGETISGDDPTAVTLWCRAPLRPGFRTPLELLEEGRVEEVEQHASQLLFDRSRVNAPTWRLAQLSEDDDLPLRPSKTDYRPDDFG